jgi:hypothetical protein
MEYVVNFFAFVGAWFTSALIVGAIIARVKRNDKKVN